MVVNICFTRRKNGREGTDEILLRPRGPILDIRIREQKNCYKSSGLHCRRSPDRGHLDPKRRAGSRMDTLPLSSSFYRYSLYISLGPMALENTAGAAHTERTAKYSRHLEGRASVPVV